MDTTILVGISLILATILAFLVFRRKSKQQGITKPSANKPAANPANNKSQPSKQPSQQAKTSTAKPKPKKPQSKPKPKENTATILPATS
jgi:cell division septation protein DedD